MQQDVSRIAEQSISLGLSADEKILWSGQPPGKLQFNVLNVITIPIGAVLLAFGVFWELLVWQMVSSPPSSATYQSPLPPILIGISFFAVGLFLIFGMFFVDIYLRKHTYYVVTNLHVIIMTKWLATNIRSLALEQLPLMTLKTKPNGSGNIYFGSTGPVVTIGSTGSTPPPSFDKIDDVRKVHDIILDAQQQVGK